MEPTGTSTSNAEGATGYYRISPSNLNSRDERLNIELDMDDTREIGSRRRRASRRWSQNLELDGVECTEHLEGACASIEELSRDRNELQRDVTRRVQVRQLDGLQFKRFSFRCCEPESDTEVEDVSFTTEQLVEQLDTQQLEESRQLDPQQMTDQLMNCILHHDMEGVERLVTGMNMDMRISQDDMEAMFPLLLATMVGDARVMRLLLRAGCDVNQMLEKPAFYLSRFPTALHQAVHGGNSDVVQVLLEQPNIDLEVRNSDMHTPLLLASESGMLEIAKLLIRSMSDLNACDDRGNNALHIAISSTYWNEDMVRLLIKSGVNINKLNHSGLTPVKIAALAGNLTVVRLLLQAGCDLGLQQGMISDREAAVLTADHQRVQSILLSDLINIPDESLHFAARYGNKLMMLTLLKHCSSFIDLYNCQGETPVLVACRHKNLDTLMTLLKHGASPSKPSMYDLTPLTRATWDNNLTMVQLLVQYGASLDFGLDSNTAAIHRALFCGLYKIATYLIQCGCGLNGAAFHLVQANKDWLLLPSLYGAGWLPFVNACVCRLLRRPHRVQPKNLLPWLQHISCNPASLQQSCCWSIRRVLGPRLLVAIQQLSIPSALKKLIVQGIDVSQICSQNGVE